MAGLLNFGAGGNPSPVVNAAGADDHVLDEDLSSKVELYISARGLEKRDTFSNTDPFAVLYQKNQGGAWQELGRSETVQDNQNPDFTTQFVLVYHFEEMQQFCVKLYDRDSTSDRLTSHDFLGEAEFSMGNLMGSVGQTLSKTLSNNRRSGEHGQLIVRGEELSGCADVCHIRMSARGLDNKDGFFGKSDPFLVISRCREDGSWVRVFKSEHVDNNLSPSWRQFSIPSAALCNGDYDRPLRWEVWDYDSDGSHDFIGGCQMSPNDLQSRLNTEVPVINEARAKKKGKKYKNSGRLVPSLFQIEARHTWLDYIKGGCEVNLCVAIDFTASNGNPSASNSLHYMDPTGRPNAYQNAIRTIGDIVADYDHDKLFPVYGYGAKYNNQVNHCFPLTFDPARPFVAGVEGILGAYQHALGQVRLSGPTLLHPIINAVAAEASQHVSQEAQKYYVLLIITDGACTDMRNAIDAVVAASGLPLSIIIVGVGQSPPGQNRFGGMEMLDADATRLRDSRNREAARDIVQFVPFEQFAAFPAELAKHTLHEVPRQFLSFMQMAGISPNAPPPPPENVFGGAPPPPPMEHHNLAQAGRQLLHMHLGDGAAPAAAAPADAPPPYMG